MDYEVSVAEGGHYILIKVHEPMTSELGRRCGAEAARLGEENNIKRFLFDLRKAPNIQNVMPNYNFAYKDMSDFGFPRASRSALLTKPDDKSHEFMETVFRNAGYQVMIFTDKPTAILWLEEE